MHVNQLAKSIHVTADTVRYYTRIGILSPSKDPINGYKNYSERDVQRLRFAARARQLGFSISDIQQIVDHADQVGPPCSMVRRLIEQRLGEMEDSLKEAQRLFNRMQAAVAVWREMPDQEPDSTIICSLIENWDQPVPHAPPDTKGA